MSKVLIGIPTRGNIHHTVASFLFHQKEKGHAIYKHTTAMSVEAGRIAIVRHFLDKDYTHLFFLDDDVSAPDYCIESLLNRNLPVVSITYPIYQNSNLHTSAYYLNNGHFIPFRLGESGFKKVDGIGLGACLIQRDVLASIIKNHKDLFRMEFNDDGDLCLGDDIKFCKYLSEYGIPIWNDFDIIADHYKTISLRSIWDNFILS